MVYSTTLRIDSLQDINVLERTELSADYVDDAETLLVRSIEGLFVGQSLYVGQLSREGCESAVIESVVYETTIRLSEALKLPHARYEPVTAVLGDSIHIHRARILMGGFQTMISGRSVQFGAGVCLGWVRPRQGQGRDCGIRQLQEPRRLQLVLDHNFSAVAVGTSAGSISR